MKTEFLKELGLEQEQIDKIMAENGKDIAAEKAKTTKAEGERDNYKSQLDTTKESLGKFDGVDVEALKKQITDLQSDLKKKDDGYTAKEAERFVPRMRGWSYDCILSPDFSLYMDMPLPMKVWNMYQSRLISAYYQSYGIPVIPTLSWA